jgi:glycerol-3-phosphate acyltransferase PlsY
MQILQHTMNNEFVLITVIIIIICYIIGSIPTAYLVGRIRKGVDIREVGSRNMGAMNVFYNVGIAEGFLVLAVDIGKGTLALYIASLLARPLNQPLTESLDLLLLIELIAGLAVVLGHTFSAFLKFRGGKGGATTIGVLAFLLWPWSPIYLGVFLLLLLITRVPTVSYGLSFVCFPFLAWFTKDQSVPILVFSILILLIPALTYIPRIKEMYQAGGGSWRRVILRKSVKDRL